MKRVQIAPLLMAVMLIFSGCGGGGGETRIPTAVDLKLSASAPPAGTSIGALDVTLTLPDGVTIQADSSGIISDSVFLYGSAIPTNTLNIKGAILIPASQGIKAKVVISMAVASGFSGGEFAVLKCGITNGKTPVAADFVIEKADFQGGADLNNIATIPGITVTPSLVITSI